MACILAQSAGVPTLPWSGTGLRMHMSSGSGHDEQVTGTGVGMVLGGELVAAREVSPELYARAAVESAEQAHAAALLIGFPVMLKAAAAGGGRGALSLSPLLSSCSLAICSMSTL